ncbi:MAG TPA: hypothetical protein VGU68_13475 [Ktedonobacteraceae bacterium]|nr:hypothetical protein [Ktedonobacteraceae bacterium]
MNTQPLELEANVENSVKEAELLSLSGFSQDEIVSLLWLRRWYQNGGSDRVEIVRHLEFLRLLVLNGRIDV